MVTGERFQTVIDAFGVEDAKKSLGNFSFLGSNRMENLLKLHI